MLADVTKTTEVALPVPCGCLTEKRSFGSRSTNRLTKNDLRYELKVQTI